MSPLLAMGFSGAGTNVATASPSGSISMGPQAMEGDLKLSPGAVLKAGYDFTIPGAHPEDTVQFASAQVTFQPLCVSGGNSAGTLVVPLVDARITVPQNSSAWYPSGNQHDPSVYQGSIWVPDLCGGGQITLKNGGTFTATATASDTSHTVNVRWHYSANGSSGSWSGTKTVTPGTLVLNTAPVVNAGPDAAIDFPPGTASLHGTATDDGLPNRALAVSWSKVSGPGNVTFTPSDAAQTTATFTAPGIYVLRLTGDDSQLSASDDVTVVVSNANTPPQVNAGPDQDITLPVQTVTLAGQVSDDGRPVGATLTSTWTVVSPAGASVVFGNANAAATTATFPGAGDYVVRLTANDTQLQASADMKVSVHSEPPPVIGIQDASVLEGQEGTTRAVLVVTLSKPWTQPVTVDYRTVDGTATAGCDYQTQFGTVRFDPGATSAAITIPIVGDLIPEADETVLLQLANASGATLGQAQATLTIVDDDGANAAPSSPFNRTPPDRSTGITLPPVLSWSATDPDPGDALTHDVHLGTAFDTSTQSWTKACTSTPGPGPRQAAVSGYDESTDRLMMFGGSATAEDAVWVLANASATGGVPTWSSVASTGGPTGLMRAAAAYDASANRLVAYGGCTGDCTSASDETWILANANGIGGTPAWTPLSASGPGPLLDPAGVFDPVARRFIVFGGAAGPEDAPVADVWVLKDLDGQPSWERLQTTGDAPAARAGMSASYDPDANLLVVFGGHAGTQSFKDVWVLRHANGTGGASAWSHVQAAGTAPPSRWGHAAAYDPVSDRLVVFGGSTAAPDASRRFVFGDLWMLTNVTGASPQWIGLTPGGGPSGRVQPTAAYGVGANRLLLVGGGTKTAGPTDDVWFLANAIGSLPLVSGHQTASSYAPDGLVPGARYFWRVVARDTHGTWRGSPVWRFTSNRPPLVDAGADQTITLPTDTVNLTGTATDDGLPTGSVLATSWNVVSGPGPVTFGDASSVITTASFVAPGTYVLRLSASDSQLTTTDDVTVTLVPSVPPNLPPVVDAGPSQTVTLATNPNALPLVPTLVPISLAFNNPIGLAYHPPTNKLVASVNYSSGQPRNFELIAADGSRTQFTNIAGLTDEVYMAIARDEGNGLSRGGFAAGEMFTGSGVGGVIVRISPDGTHVQNPWVQLPGETGLLRGQLRLDRTGVFGGDLIVSTTAGHVWRVNAAGQPTLLASLPAGALEGLETVPNDPLRYGPWAGRIITGGEERTSIYAIDAAGHTDEFDVGIAPEGIHVIPPDENFFGVDFASRTVWGIPSSEMVGLVGDILIPEEVPGNLWLVHWNGAIFVTTKIAQVPQWEGTAFAPAGIAQVASTSATVSLDGSVSDDGLPIGGSLTSTWSEVAGPGTATVVDPASPHTSATLSTPGTYVLRLTASDTKLSASSDATLTVLANRPPVVDAGLPQEVVAPGPATLTGSVTDDGLPAGGQLTRYWTKLVGPGRVTFEAPVVSTEQSFSPTTNPSGAWTFGWTPTRGGAFTAYVAHGPWLGGLPGWFHADAPQPSPPNFPLVLFNDTGAPSSTVPAGALLLHPGPSGENSVARWTPPAAGTFLVQGRFFALDTTSTDVSVLLDSATVLSGTVSGLGSGVPFSFVRDLQAGDTLDFSVGFGNGGYFNDATGLTATITAAGSATTNASFSLPGDYLLRLSAYDSEAFGFDDVAVSVAPVCVATPSGALGWWPGDGNAGDLVGGHTGVAEGELAFASGEVGQAFSFNGTDADVIIPANPAFNTGSLTLEAWVYPTDLTQYRPLLEFWSPGHPIGVHLWQSANGFQITPGTLYANVRDVNAGDHIVFTPRGTLVANRWTHVALTYDQATRMARLYANGVAVAAKDVGVFTPQRAWPLEIGVRPAGASDGNTYRFLGKIDEVGVYGRALSADEILNLYAAGQAGRCKPTGAQPPVVSAGLDQTITLPTDGVTLNGTATDPAGAPLTTSWSAISGPGSVTFGSASSPDTTAKLSGIGSYVLRLTASTAQLTASSDVTVTLLPPPVPNTAPIVSAGNPQTVPAMDAPHRGRIVVNNDEWTLTDALGFPGGDAAAFARNLGRWLTGGRPGNFLVYSTSFGLTGGKLAAAMRAEGHQWTVSRSVDFSLPNLLQYDAIFLAGDAAPNAVLIDYVRAGGSVYLAAGTGTVGGGAADEAAQWKPFVNALGIDLETQYNFVSGSLAVTTPHALLEGVGHLFYSHGNSVHVLDPRDPNTRLIHVRDGKGLLGVFEEAVPLAPGATVTLDGTASDDGLPSGRLTFAWSELSGPSAVSFADPFSLTTTATLSGAGIYVLRLTASDGQLSSSADVVITVQATNHAPVVDAGPDQAVTLPGAATLSGTATDDGHPVGVLSTVWTMVSGRALATFADPTALTTSVTFSAPGIYVLRLSASDSVGTSTDDITISVGRGTCLEPPAGLLGWWPGDGTGEDLAGARTATVSGVSFQPGVVGSSFAFGGSGSVTVPALADDLASLTLEAWVRRTDLLSDPRPILEFGFSTVIGVDLWQGLDAQGHAGTGASGVLFANLVDTTGTSHVLATAPGALTNNEWNHVALTYDQATGVARIYVDGAVAATALVGSFTPLTSLPLSFGHRASSGESFLGGIDEVGLFDRALSDAEVEAIFLAGGLGRCKGDNRAPSVDAGPNQFIALPTNTLTLNGTAGDDGLPNPPAALTISWTQISGPAGVSFGTPAAAVTTATFPSTGVYVLRLSASDSVLTTTDDMTVTVNPAAANQSPTVSAGAAQNITLPMNTALLRGTVSDDGLPNPPGAVTLLWSKVSGPGTVTFANPGSPTTDASFDRAGVYILRLTASDSALASSSDVKVTVNPPAGTIVVSAGANQTITLPTTSVTLTGTASNASGTPLTFAWSRLSGPGQVVFGSPLALITTATFDGAGVFVLRLSATDGLSTATSDVTVVVQGTTPVGPPPSSSITSPADGTRVTGRIDVVGSVASATLFRWTLEYRRDNDADFTRFASGTTAISNATLGTFDPTLLLNGIYEIRFTAFDTAARTASTSVKVVVRDNQKVGQFSVSFQDLEVPLAGLPIRVTRTYDSRDKGKGDFGVGWRLDLSNVRLAEKEVAGLAWAGVVVPGFFPSYCLQPTSPQVVTVTLPDGKVLEFQPVITPSCQTFVPIETATVSFQALPGTHATLAPAGDGYVFVEGSWPGPMQLYDGTTYDIYDPDDYVLTMPDGRQFSINQEKGLTQIKDLNGNVLTVSAAGITHSSGRGIAFTRDAQGRITQITDPESHSMTYAYDANGDLRSFTDRETHTTSFSYDPSLPHFLSTIQDPRGIQPIRNEYYDDGRIKSHTDAFGKTITYVHDVTGRQEVVTDRDGGVRVLVYDERGNVVSETDPEGKVVDRTFDALNNRLSETLPHDPAAVSPPKTTYVYDVQDDLRSVTDPENHTTEYTYNSRKQVILTKDPRGTYTVNDFDAQGNLLSTKVSVSATGSPALSESSYTYRSDGNVETQTAMIDGVPSVAAYEYDGFGNMTKQTDALGHAMSYTYDRDGNRLTQTTTRTTQGSTETLTTTYTYDRLGHLLQTTDPDGTSTHTVYDELGKQKETYDKLDHRTAYDYDDMGRLIRTTYADLTTEESTYDGEGHRLTSKDRAGRVTSYTYDHLGRLTRTTYPDTTLTENTYDSAGRLVATKDARGKTTTYLYDNAGRRTSVKVPLGGGVFAETVFTYDANGNQQTVRDPNLHTTTYEYDEQNRRTKTIFPDTSFTLTSYDSVGRRKSEQDQAGKVTQFRYDVLGRLVKVIDALTHETTYDYDELGNRVSQIDSNLHITRFEYDKLGRETARVLPDGTRETKTYDAAGNLKTRTDFNGKTTTYDYDVNNRLVSRTYEGGVQPPVSFTYTATGRRKTATVGAITTTYDYDNRDRLSLLLNSDGRKLEYSYDPNGNRTNLKATVAGQTRETTFSYDDANRLDLVVDPVGRSVDHGFDANGNRTSLAFPNGVLTTYGYDDLNRLKNLTTRHPSSDVTIQSYAFTLGPAGNRTKITENDGAVRDYGYDDLYRLTSEKVTVGALTQYQKDFTYDFVGNRKTQATNGAGAAGTPTAPGSIAYGYDDRDRLLAETLGTNLPTSHTYDVNGNLITTGAEATYTWDLENRLIRVTKTTGTIVEHGYDADGNRLQTKVTPQTGPSTVTNFLVDTSSPLSQVVAETDAVGTLRAYYVRGDDLLAVMRPLVANPATAADWQTRFFHADGIGSIRRLTNESGQITDGYTYTAFGEQIAHTGSDSQPYAFAGEPYDPNVGFQYHRARWMDPATGRFESMDPLAVRVSRLLDPPNLHRYTYANDNPAMLVDPTGLESAAEASISTGINTTLNAQSIVSTRATQLAVNRTAGKALEAFLERLVQEEFPQATIRAQRALTGPGGRRVYDLLVRIGDRFVIIESKTNLPIGGSAFRRLIGQILTFANAAEAEAAGAQVIVFSEGATEAALTRIVGEIGLEASPQFVHGAVELLEVLRTLLLGV